MREQRVILVSNRADIELVVSGSAGAATLSPDIYEPILDELESHRIMSLGEIEVCVRSKNISFVQLLQAIMVLFGAYHLEPAQPDNVIKQAQKKTLELNKHLLKKARSNGDINYLVSPVTGGGITLSRFNQLFISALQEGNKDPAAVARHVWKILAMQSQKLVSDGKIIENEDENIAELQRQATDFMRDNLPILKSLLIV